MVLLMMGGGGGGEGGYELVYEYELDCLNLSRGLWEATGRTKGAMLWTLERRDQRRTSCHMDL